ncbi:hypothetical protein MKK55_12975 [Methylobacterium sp. J-059]|uniref:hypothetical protein n=1 Tax=Methylobacterium sp. J-059 TaxID=2836643 RepID=UPI001FBA2999|nr:hypothetical protein [Methylobacterium sp. J-059]MCJ2039845.1 hypothetical protein [Methylobacterium sp. J-059]
MENLRPKYRPPAAATDQTSTGGTEPPAPPPPPPISPSDRKLAARRFNESLKLVTSGLSGLGLGLCSVAFLQPLLTDPALFVKTNRPVWYLIGLGLHVVGHLIVHFELRKEE